jgi:Zn-dependent peptidase ImmA (M78 family)
MFTLAHELAHLWAGESGVSDVEAGRVPKQRLERWCNAVAAELLVPMDALRAELNARAPVAEEIQRLARVFKVSSLVVLRRLFDAQRIDGQRLWSLYREEQARLHKLDRGSAGGGDFYRTLGVRTGKRFARAVLSSALEGQTLFQDAMRMLGIRRTPTLYEAARELGVTP